MKLYFYQVRKKIYQKLTLLKSMLHSANKLYILFYNERKYYLENGYIYNEAKIISAHTSESKKKLKIYSHVLNYSI